MQIIARLLSYIFHPLLIPTYAIFFLVYVNPYLFGTIPSYHSFFILRTVVLYSVAYPLIVFLLMRLLGFIESYQIKDQKQMILMYMPTAFFFLWTCIVYYKSEYNEILSDVMLGATIILSLGLFLTAIAEKISIHAMSMGGLLAVVLFSANIASFDISLILTSTILLAGVIGTSLLLLNKHQPREIYRGYMVGFMCQAIAFLF